MAAARSPEKCLASAQRRVLRMRMSLMFDLNVDVVDVILDDIVDWEGRG